MLNRTTSTVILGVGVAIVFLCAAFFLTALPGDRFIIGLMLVPPVGVVLLLMTIAGLDLGLPQVFWRHRVRWTVALVLVVAGLSALVLTRGPSPVTLLIEEGRGLVLDLEGRRQFLGQYPQTLSESVLNSEVSGRFGGWEYDRADDDSFRLSVGDYRRHGFEVSYAPRTGWYVDS